MAGADRKPERSGGKADANALLSECPTGLSGSAEVDISLIVRAVNNTLNGCGVG
jgi:hypothetical protein